MKSKTLEQSEAQQSETYVRSVVLPVYGEDIGAVTRLVDALRESGWDEVVVSADEPDERTKRGLNRLRERDGVELSVAAARRGKGGALRDGLAETTGDVLGFVDADDAVSVEDLDRIYTRVESGEAAVAIGSRDIEGESRNCQGVLRRTLASGYRRTARTLTGVPVNDFQCGAKAFRRDAWNRVANSLEETGFTIDTEMVAQFHRAGFSIREVPIDWQDPGDSAVDPISDTADMLGSLVSIRRRLPSAADARPDRSRPLKVALVSSHPPNRGHLAEYGEELAKAYGAREDIETVVFARKTAGAPNVERFDDYEVRRVWKRDSLRGAADLVRELRAGEFDVVHFNIHMTYFGNTNVHRFLGLALPPVLSSTMDAKVVTTMHDFLEVVEEDVVDESVGRVERAGAFAATQLLLLGDATTVTSKEYLETVTNRYYAPDVHHVPHGTFVRADGGIPRIDGPFRVMVFGHLSPTKDIETVAGAFERVREEIPDAELVVAGGSHPGFPGYREELESKYGDRPGVEFVGYVEDDDMDGVWRDASVVLMPYRTMTGVSGVFQLAKSYGRPVVASDVDGMRTSTVETGGTATFVPPGDSDALAAELIEMWTTPGKIQEASRVNAAAAGEYTIAETADRLVEIFTE